MDGFCLSCSVVEFDIGNLSHNSRNQLPLLANTLLASLSYLLSRSPPVFDLHISQTVDNEKVIVVIPGAKKALMQIQIEEYLAKLFEFEVDPEVAEFLEKCEKKLDEIIATACKHQKEDKKDLFEGSFRLNSTIRQLETLYHGLLGLDDLDESLFVKTSNVIFFSWRF